MSQSPIEQTCLASDVYFYFNFRIIHKVNQWLRNRFSPAGFLILGGLIASGIFGIDTRQSLAFQIFAISVSLLLASIISSFTFRGRFQLHRQLPEYGTVTFPLKYKIVVSNLDNHQHSNLLLIDELAAKFPKYETFLKAKDTQDSNRNWIDLLIGCPRLMSLIQKIRGGSLPLKNIDSLVARDEKEIEIEFTPVRRGYLNFSRLKIARPDPFGLFRAMRVENNLDNLLILPKTYRIPHMKFDGHRKYRQGGMNQASAIGESQEFLSLRGYQPGNPLRAIHWRSYAKRGEPIVKEFTDEFFVRQGLVLDTFVDNVSESKFEEAVSIAASFALSVKEQDSLLYLMFVGTESYRFTSGRSFGNATKMLEILACVTPCISKDILDLQDLVQRYVNEISGLIFVMLDWDSKRRELIRQFVSMKMPVLVLVIQEETEQAKLDKAPLANHPNRLIGIPVNNIQNTLDQINWQDI